MTAMTHSATNIGFEGKLITVECDASQGLPGLVIVGLGNKAIDEAKERVRSAIKNTGLDFPRKRITINLAPANLPKDGSHFDLPMAISLLVVGGKLKQDQTEKIIFVGELALDGSLRPVSGVIGLTETALLNGIKTVIMPTKNCAQASLVENIEIIGASSLREVYLHLTREQIIAPYSATALDLLPIDTSVSIDDIYGQEQAKRAIAIAAAGHHNILLDGPPGSGKTMLAKALASLLPPLATDEVIEVTKLHSLAGETFETVVTKRPFRSPHHSSSHVSLIGGGRHPKPGEISLAHRGVLFLDEMPEYNRQALEALRQPLEDRQVHISRANDRATFPADFMLVATKNPCPCGYIDDPNRECLCTAIQVNNYQKRISGPLTDRIDLIVQVSRVDPEKLLVAPPKASEDYKTMVLVARTAQIKRFKSKLKTNAQLTNRDIKEIANLEPAARAFLDNAASKLDISARSYFKVIKVARTIADLERSPAIEVVHVSEALQYRSRFALPH